MRALVYQGSDQPVWVDKPKPTLISSTDAIIKMTKTALCGNDPPIIRDETRVLTEGLTLGQAGVGIVDEIGTDVKTFRVGEKVLISRTPPDGRLGAANRDTHESGDRDHRSLGRLIDGTIAEFARIPDADLSLQHVPEGVDDSTLMMLMDLLPTGLECRVPDGQIQPGTTVAVFGCGPVGLTALLLAQFHSPAEIIMVDTSPRGFEAAVALGATGCVHAVDGDALDAIARLCGVTNVNVAIVANAKVALRSLWRSYGQSTLPVQRTLLMPSRRLCDQDSLGEWL
jgi:alcohol dehydrogenase